MKVISHSADADGRLSAYLVGRYFGLDNESDFIMTDYGMHTDFLSKIEKDEEVYICDFSFEDKFRDMAKLMKITENITWIDHHKSSIAEYGDFGTNIKGLRIDGIAACMLTYCWLYEMDEGKLPFKKEMIDKAPWVVKLVHDNDVWAYEYGDRTAAFKLGLDAEDMTSPLDHRWRDLFNNDEAVEEIVNSGRYMIKYRDAIGKFACETAGFEYTINGKKGFCLNNVFGGSPFFGDKIKEYDFVCCFHFVGSSKYWEYSFYSDESKNTDCAKLATSVDLNGGGHLRAAGCTSKKFIFSN